MTRPLASLAALTSLAALLASCSLLRPLDGLACEPDSTDALCRAAGAGGHGSTGGQGGAGGEEAKCVPGAANASCHYGDACMADADCATASCSNEKCQCPTSMVPIESRFCIDTTEVTNAAYSSFIATKPDPASQDGVCAWNKHFLFGDDMSGPLVCQTRDKTPDHPASCINWCQARAYCKSLGKRLCGKIHGGMNPDEDYANPTRSEWFDACSNGGERVFPTGNKYDPQSCNGDSSGPVAAGSPGQERCEAATQGLQHMSGNVREWEDSCSAEVGAGDTCLTRGGSFDSGDAPSLQCDMLEPAARDDTDNTIGFRCCSG